MAYVEEVCRSGAVVEVRRYFTPRWHPPGEKRGKKEKLTTEEQLRVNERQAEIKFRRLVNANFVPGDYHLVLSYSKENRPETVEQMKKDWQTFRKTIKRWADKAGIPFKYVQVYEIGSKGAMHIHMIVNQIPVEMLRAGWRFGRIRITPLDDSGQYSELASYLLKYSSRQLRDTGRLQGKRWNASKNLRKPEIVKRIIAHVRFSPHPRERKGYYIDKNMTCNYIDAAGYPHMQVVYVKTKRKRE